MKTYKHSKFELIHIEPNEDIEKITFKRNFFLTKETKDMLLNNIKKHCYAVLDKKEDKLYGIITLEIDEWNGIATFDFNEIENHTDKDAMYRLSMLLCHLAKDISKNAKTIIIKNHLFNEHTLSLLWEESFRYKNKEEDDAIFIRKGDRDTENTIMMIFLFVAMIFLFMNLL